VPRPPLRWGARAVDVDDRCDLACDSGPGERGEEHERGRHVEVEPLARVAGEDGRREGLERLAVLDAGVEGLGGLRGAGVGEDASLAECPAMVEELVARFVTLAGAAAPAEERLTLACDAGQNSEGNYELLDRCKLSFAGSLPPSDHPDLLAVAKSRYRAVDKKRFAGLTAFETRKAVFGKQRRLVVCHSDGLHEKQSRGFDQTLAKAHRQLAEVQARLARGTTRKAKEKAEAEIAAIVAPRWVARVVAATVTGEAPAELRLGFRTDDHARAGLEEELFGKRILFTDKTEEQATTATIVAACRSQEAVEGDFRQMKDPAVVSFSPMFHFTESKIRVRAFYCVLALMVARLMIREAEHAGMHMSVRELLGHLAGIQETLLLYQGERGRPRARRMLTEIDPIQHWSPSANWTSAGDQAVPSSPRLIT